MAHLHFAKQPVRPGSAPTSDSDTNHHATTSLLSAMLHSPRSPRSTGSHGSSGPSTAISSPHPHSDAPSNSILRRASFSSDGEVHDFGQSLDAVVFTQTDPVKRNTSLKFAVAPHRPLAERHPARPADVATTSPIDPSDPDSDDGYQEDEEDSEEEERGRPPKFPFARSTNYRRKRLRSSPSPPPAPATLPPPPRRGRGHVHVAEGTSEKEGRCSRHRSPPPVKSRSRSRERRGRLSDAGPREGRAGSPMPQALEDSDEDEEESLVKDESPIKEDVFSSPRLQESGRRRSENLPFRPTVKSIDSSASGPVVDDTPTLAASIARLELNFSGGLEHRLERSLSQRHAVM